MTAIKEERSSGSDTSSRKSSDSFGVNEGSKESSEDEEEKEN